MEIKKARTSSLAHSGTGIENLARKLSEQAGKQTSHSRQTHDSDCIIVHRELSTVSEYESKGNAIERPRYIVNDTQ